MHLSNHVLRHWVFFTAIKFLFTNESENSSRFHFFFYFSLKHNKYYLSFFFIFKPKLKKRKEKETILAIYHKNGFYLEL